MKFKTIMVENKGFELFLEKSEVGHYSTAATSSAATEIFKVFEQVLISEIWNLNSIFLGKRRLTIFFPSTIYLIRLHRQLFHYEVLRRNRLRKGFTKVRTNHCYEFSGMDIIHI